MSMTPQKELELDTFWFLRMIESDLIDHPEKNEVNFPFKKLKIRFSETEEAPSYNRQKVIIKNLEKQKVLEFKTKGVYTYSTAPKLSVFNVPSYDASSGMSIEKQDFLIINRKKFEEIYPKFKTKVNKYEMIRSPLEEDSEKGITISKTIKNKYKDIETDFRDKKGWLQFEKGKKWIDLGGYNTRTYGLVKYILSPNSKSKKINDIFEYLRILKDNKNEELKKETPRAYQLKKEIIKKTVAELQKEQFLKGHINKPIFDDNNKTAIIILK